MHDHKPEILTWFFITWFSKQNENVLVIIFWEFHFLHCACFFASNVGISIIAFQLEILHKVPQPLLKVSPNYLRFLKNLIYLLHNLCNIHQGNRAWIFTIILNLASCIFSIFKGFKKEVIETSFHSNVWFLNKKISLAAFQYTGIS